MPAKKTENKAAAPAKKEAAPAAKKTAKKAAAKKAPAAEKAAKSSARPPLDAIARAAYLNYRRRVEQSLPGDSHGDWLEAERQLSEG